MKNRFLVINKEKIYAYVVSIMTIVTIFFMTSMMNSNLKDTEEVYSNDIENSVNIITDAEESPKTAETSSAIGDAAYTEEGNL